MSYLVDKPPSEDPLLQRQVRTWEPKEHKPVMSASRSAFKTYNTYVDMLVANRGDFTDVL